MNIQILAAIIVGAALWRALQVGSGLLSQYLASRKQPPEPGPAAAAESLALGGVEGLREEYRRIIKELAITSKELKRLRKQGPTAAYGPTDLAVALLEYANFSDRRREVETLIEEISR